MTFEQTAALQEGDKVVVMKTTNGTITIKMFSEEAPKNSSKLHGFSSKRIL